MITRTLAQRGTHAAVWLPGDIVYVAWQDGDWLHRETVNDHMVTVLDGKSLGPNAGAFPVFTSHNGRVILAYRLGEPSFAAVFIDADTGDEIYRTPFRVDGNNPIAMSATMVFAQHADADGYAIWWTSLAHLSAGQWMTSTVRGRGTGLSRIVDGMPVLVDNDRASQPGMALVSYAPDGRLVAGERADVPGTPDGGVIVRRLT